MTMVTPIELAVNVILSNPIASTVLCVFLVWVTWVRFYSQRQIGHGDIRVDGAIETLRHIGASSTYDDLAQAHHFAVLSAEVYGEPDQEGKPRREWQTTCRRCKQIYDQWGAMRLPASFANSPKGVKGKQSTLDSPLQYCVWYRERDQHEVDVVLAFAGTNGVKDMWSNLDWVTRFWPFSWNQYDLAATIGVELDDYLHKHKFSDKRVINMVATGHSLGGGLAHTAAYAAQNIKKVYAFDSTSVTGFYKADRLTRTQSKQGMRIYRIHERGELLGYLRALVKVVYPVSEKNPAIIDATINFERGNAIGQHSIERLACALVDHSATK